MSCFPVGYGIMTSANPLEPKLSPQCPYTQVTIFGLGLIGGSLIMAIRQAYPNLFIHAVDPNEATLQQALRQNLIDKASLSMPDSFEGTNHLIVLAAHVPMNLHLLKTLAPKVKGQAITVTDIGSCKREIVKMGAELLPRQFIGGHPMAGREVSGFENAMALLFIGKRFLLTPHPDHPNEDRVNELSQFLSGIGMRPSLLNVDEHDRIMAIVSHLPQLYSIILTNLIAKHEPGKILTYQGTGIEGHLRLAASPYAMWGPVFEENSENLTHVIDEMQHWLSELKTALHNPQAMEKHFRISNQMYRAFLQLAQTNSLSNPVLSGKSLL